MLFAALGYQLGRHIATPDSTGTSWLQRTLDPTGVQMSYNTAEAQAQRSFNKSEAETARLFSAVEAQKNRDFQERMSSTAYQRAVSDMKRAGLNPYMAAVNGGASTPSGAMANSYSASGAAASGAFGSNAQLASSIFSALANSAVRISGMLLK